MIISHGRKYIFVHIPKTGGTALSQALEKRAMKDDVLIGDTPKAKRRRARLQTLNPAGRLWKHSTLRDIAGVVSDPQMAEYFVVTLVRNPWDRMVSYYHWLRDQGWDHPAVSLAKSTTFADFVMADDTARSIAASGYGTYVTDAAGQEICDQFIRIEHLAQDLAPFEDHLGFRIGPIERINVSNRDRDYRTYYRDETAERVAGYCAADITRFGYEF